MSIEIKINIPDEDIGLGTAALAKRLAVFGCAIAATVPEPALIRNLPAGKTVVLPPIGNSLSIDSDGTVETITNTARAGESAEQTEARTKRTRKAKDDKPQISANPENRAEPEAVVDDEETAQQDADDEAAEVEASRDPVKPATVEDVKKAIGLYIAKHGMPATQEDGPKMFEAVLGKPPNGADIWKLSLLADADQATLAKAIKAWEVAAVAEKRFGV